MRKHLYLITDHPDEEKVGLLKITESRLRGAKKNEERTLRAVPKSAFEDDDVSIPEARFEYRCVGLGYVDFDDEADYDENIADEVDRKLGEIDAEYLEKSGHDPAEVLA